MAAKMPYDALILGGGPAGLSTALGLGRQSRKCLIISHDLYRNDGIEASHAVLGHDHINPRAIWARARDQIRRYQNTEYENAEIVAVERARLPHWSNREGFQLRSSDGRSWIGRTLVLAAGVKDQLPALDGYEHNWPRNIYQCLFCDGWERREHPRAILSLDGVTGKDVAMASMALGLDTRRRADGRATTTILTNGSSLTEGADEVVAKRIKALKARGVQIDQRKIIKLENAEPEGDGVYVHLQNGAGESERVWFGFLVHKPPTELNVAFVIEQLGLEIQPGMFGPTIKVGSTTSATNVPGVFAAGDCSNQLTHVTSAMLSGIGAAGGVTHYLNEKDDEDALEDYDQAQALGTEVLDDSGCAAP